MLQRLRPLNAGKEALYVPSRTCELCAVFLNSPWVASQCGVWYPAELQCGSCSAILLLLLLLTCNGEVARVMHNVTCLAQEGWWMYTHIVLTYVKILHVLYSVPDIHSFLVILLILLVIKFILLQDCHNQCKTSDNFQHMTWLIPES